MSSDRQPHLAPGRVPECLAAWPWRQAHVNVVPVIAKSDTMTLAERDAFRRLVLSELKAKKVTATDETEPEAHISWSQTGGPHQLEPNRRPTSAGAEPEALTTPFYPSTISQPR